MLKLLIREIEPNDKNGRYLRENLRRIEEYLADVAAGKQNLITLNNLDPLSGYVYYETHQPTFDGQTVFILANMPKDPAKVRMTINACEMVNGVHFTVVGQTVTFDPISADFDLEANNELGQPDYILFQYLII